MTEFLDDIFILEELGLTPIWLEKKTEENKTPHFLAYQFNLKEIKKTLLRPKVYKKPSARHLLSCAKR